jgi:hypothetical protein
MRKATFYEDDYTEPLRLMKLHDHPCDQKQNGHQGNYREGIGGQMPPPCCGGWKICNIG